MLAILSVLFLYLCSPVCGVFQKLYCSISDSCDCDFKPNIKDLEWDLYKNVYGQHLAQDIVSEEVARFLQNKSPERPLVLSFHGSSGTGKTLVSSMLGNHLYGLAMSSPYVHQFVPMLHFPLPDRVQEYRELKSWVQGNLTECARSIFLFDEMEKMPPGLIDVLEPFLGPSHVVFRTNYRKAIYVFISTSGEEVIHRKALESRQAGRDREEITAEDFQEAIARRFLPVLHPPSEAHHALRSLPAAEPASRGALRPLAALSAGQLRPRRRGGGGGRRYDLRPRAGTLLLHHRLQGRPRQNKPLPVSRGRELVFKRLKEREWGTGGKGGLPLEVSQ
ncbi:prosalusin isoform X2 [Anarrhichthys ocellatus]|uniref:prosalusin isoform X2 n=1 Tax=Anarrhichthys ocellatus TaxID=433405 RepID=UPI0012ECDAD2|nr:prosalusin-like isoform X2 [Anarrhichthys ocellatus]